MIIQLQLVLPFNKLREFTWSGGEEWCKGKFQGNWHYDFDYDKLHIEDERDVTLFMLTWL